MKQLEIDLLAKSIRNSTIPISGKNEIAKMFAEEMLKIDQFFNHKRFFKMAIMELDKGWPNKLDKYYEKQKD